MDNKIKTIAAGLLMVIITIILLGGLLTSSFKTMFGLFVDSNVTDSSDVRSETDTSDTPVVCQSINPVLGDKSIILRIDDIQAFTWNEVLYRMVLDAEVRGIPLVLAIIPKGVNEDVELVKFLKKHECNLEFALHGWDHLTQDDGISPEFLGISTADVRERILGGIEEMKKITNRPIQTWVPPENNQSLNVAVVLKEMNIKRISAEGTGEWDYDATTFDYGKDLPVDSAQTLSQCEQVFLNDDKCVVMLHLQNYAKGLDIDEDLYQSHYVALLDLFLNTEYKFARFEDLSR